MALQLYQQSQNITGANIGQARVQNPSLNLSYGRQQAEQAKLLWKGIGDLTKGGLKAGLTWLQADRAANVAEQTNAFNRELMLFQADYKKNKQGKDALGAGAAFDEFASSTMQRYMDEGDFDNAERTMFTRSTSAMATSFMGQGYSYAAEQEKSWKTTVAKGTLAELDQFVATNYKNQALVDSQKEMVKEELAAMYPGLDNTAQNAAIDQEVAMNQIGSFIADKNLTAAEAYLENNRALLGGKADEMTYRINSQRESMMRLALAAEARSDKLAAAALKAKGANAMKDITDLVHKQDYESAQQVLAENRNALSASEYATYQRAIFNPTVATTDSLFAVQALQKTMSLGGDLDLLQNHARELYLSGQLTQTSYEAYNTTDTWSESQKQGYNQSKQLIDSITGTEYNEFTANMKFNLYDSLLSYVHNNPQAKPDEIVNYARQRIGVEQSLDPNSNPSLIKVSPYYTRAQVLGQSNLDRKMVELGEAEKKLVTDMRQGLITRAEYLQEARVLRNIRKMFENQQKLQTQ